MRAILLVLVLAAGSVSGQDAPDLKQLQDQYQKALQAKDYEKAIALATDVAALQAQPYLETLCDVAALQLKLGRRDEAYEWLEKVERTGLGDAFALRRDERFTAIRTEERFVALMRRIRSVSYIEMLERPERDAFQKPDQVMAALALRPGERVADVGAGSGYFTFRLARAVGPSGSVLACDTWQEMLDHIAKRMAKENPGNIRLVKVTPEDPALPPGGLDTILMVDTLHYVKDKPAYARTLARSLATGGRVVIIDYIPRPMAERPWGPPPEQQFSREELDAAMAAGGLHPVKVHTFLPEQFFVEYCLR